MKQIVAFRRTGLGGGKFMAEYTAIIDGDNADPIVTKTTSDHERECAADQRNVPSPFGMTRWSGLARELIRLRADNPSQVCVF